MLEDRVMAHKLFAACRMGLAVLAAAGVFVFANGHARAQDNRGPYDVRFLQGGVGIERDIAQPLDLLRSGAAFSFTTWVRPDLEIDGTTVLMALGASGPGQCRCLGLQAGRIVYWNGSQEIETTTRLEPGVWTQVSVTSTAQSTTLYANGERIGQGTGPAIATSARIAIAPAWVDRPDLTHFGGTVVGATVHDQALDQKAVRAMVGARPDFDLVHLWSVGSGWEWQSKANTGLWRPQDPWTLPRSGQATSAPVAKPPVERATLEPIDDRRWQVNGWRLAAAPDVAADGATLSRPGTAPGTWYVATVPGTVLTTLVDRGVYPDPYYGLNNLAIPERLARQDYWYRTTFTVPEALVGHRQTLVLNGVNYASQVWVNGQQIGTTTGAFIRGQFAFEPVSGQNVVAIRVSPPPHPGTPHEQSISAGVGENGGQLAIDGPTFVATEGWDWIPGIRDRDTGLWLPVTLETANAVRILDPQIVTDLPLPRIDQADVHVTVPFSNDSQSTKRLTVRAAFDGIEVEQTLDAAPGPGVAHFTPDQYPQLRVANPALWWPNGYGAPTLHTLTIRASVDGVVSDDRQVRFGIREVSYDLSLFDAAGRLRRVNVQTTDGGLKGQKLIAVGHEAIKQSPRGWAASLTPAGEQSSGVVNIAETLPEPHLTLRINGVRIAARGGNWGMDDAMKRSGRERLEPYFRLQRDAHMNIIRNWMGNNDQPSFFDLADEYGMMVLNDFWQSTQNFQVEPQDPQLFLANARDTVARYRNHPSIVLWFGRNEGVPYPMLNEGLDDVVAQVDGTRWYTGSSNVVNLQGSGPYNYRPPVGYFTDLATGFSVETGTPSLSTLEAIQGSVPKADQWPLSDALAYHDWHFAGNGDTKTFMAALDTMFGAANSLEDFERKAQMMNLETHKAMYEGFLGHLWTQNSGRLLWMTHPAWPSNAWQIYSWDYDTSAAYYGSKTATEPLHVQINQPDNTLVIVNTTQAAAADMTVTARVTTLDDHTLLTRSWPVSAVANATTPLEGLPLDDLMGRNGMVLVALTLSDRSGAVVSRNGYWRGSDPAAYRALNAMAEAQVSLTIQPAVIDGTDRKMVATLVNIGPVAALNTKLTLVDGKGVRILPAYYSDNYLMLMPGERRQVEIRYPLSAGEAGLTLRAWNIPTRPVTMTP